MSSQELEELKKRTSSAENTLKSLQSTLNSLKKRLESENKEETKIDEILEIPHKPFKINFGGGIWLFKNECTIFSRPKGSFTLNTFMGSYYSYGMSKEGIQWCINNIVETENDIWIHTYPKCGTTLATQMVYQILEKSGIKVLGSRPDLFPCGLRSILWPEFKSSQDLYVKKNNNFIKSLYNTNENNCRRLYKTHSRFGTFPCINGYNGKSKIIHITRNPKDVICSGYKFFSKGLYKGDFDTYFNFFINGFMESNNFFDYEIETVKMIKKYGKNNILYLYFEDLVSNPINEIKKIIKFLNIKNLNENEIKEICDFTSFDNQKKLQQSNKQVVGTLNKGKIGNWKNKLTKEQSNIIDQIIKQKIEPFNKELEQNMKIKWNFS